MKRHFFAGMFFYTLSAGAFFFSTLFAGNPIIAHRFTADPNAMVYNGRVYVYCSNDDDNNNNYDIASYILLWSDDMVNWTDQGEVFRVPRDASWATRAYAPACIERGGKFYLYFPDGGNSIGVAIADRPEGPFTDPLGRSLINRSMPNCDVEWCFDPAIFIDSDNTPYLYFGGGSQGTGENLRGIKLNDDMISVQGTAQTILAPESFEASFMHKRNDVYYFSYATTGASKIDYGMGDSPLGPFTHKGTVLPNPVLNGKNINRNNNNHASIIFFKDNWYLFYHDRRISDEVYKRNASVELLSYNTDGTMKPVTCTADGPAQIQSLNPFDTVQAETIGKQKGIKTSECSEGGMMVTDITDGDWIRYTGVDFGTDAKKFEARIAAETGGSIELHLDSETGTNVGTCTVEATGGFTKWETVSCEVAGATGIKDLFLKFKGTGEPFRFNWFRVVGSGTEAGATPLTIKTTQRQPFSVMVVPGTSVRNGAYHAFFDLSGRSVPVTVRSHQTRIPVVGGMYLIKQR